MADRLMEHQVGQVLLVNSLATGAALVALILTFAASGGVAMNPWVTLVTSWRLRRPWGEATALVAAQILGACAGALLAHAMFDLSLVQQAAQPRTGVGIWIGEIVATTGLIVVVRASEAHPARSAVAVSGYIVAAYWFTSSTSFANAAVTVARALTATFTGIRWVDVPPFLLAQAFGTIIGMALVNGMKMSAEVGERERKR